MIERDDEVIVNAEIPGVKKDDIDISLTENAVTIKGSSRKEEKGDYYRFEISSGAFDRTVRLPSTVDTEKAKAAFEDGMLKVTMPKISKAKRKRVKVS